MNTTTQLKPLTRQNSIFSEKQQRALFYLEHPKFKEVTEVFFGGSAGGGKSFLGCAWQISRRLKYPGTRGLIGRAKLKTLRATTLKTFIDVWNEFFASNPDGVTWRLDRQEWIIYFSNGSEIVLKDLFYYPSDPNFDSLGSLEITDAFYDELPEITEKAYTICNSRIRYKVINGVPKSYSAGNPSANWVKKRFVMDDQNEPVKLEPYQRFVPASVEDNPNKEFVRIYKAQLEKLPYFDRQRLLHGDWTLIDNDNPFFYEFEYQKNTLPKVEHRRDVDLILSFDFNTNPCTALLGYVWHGYGVYFFREFKAKGGTRGVLEKMDWLKELNQIIRITGDNSGHSNQSSAINTDYEIIEKYLKRGVEGRTKKANGSHLRSKLICNYALHNIPVYFCREGCPETINQIIGAKQTADGKLMKVGELDPHLVDCFRYFMNLIFEGIEDIDEFAAQIELRENREAQYL